MGPGQQVTMWSLTVSSQCQRCMSGHALQQRATTAFSDIVPASDAVVLCVQQASISQLHALQESNEPYIMSWATPFP
jgi:hypothetical protein